MCEPIQGWQCTTLIPALGNWKQEDKECRAILNHVESPAWCMWDPVLKNQFINTASLLTSTRTVFCSIFISLLLHVLFGEPFFVGKEFVLLWNSKRKHGGEYEVRPGEECRIRLRWSQMSLGVSIGDGKGHKGHWKQCRGLSVPFNALLWNCSCFPGHFPFNSGVGSPKSIL